MVLRLRTRQTCPIKQMMVQQNKFSLADGLNFKNGTLTTASIDDAGVVKYDVNTATITAGTDGTVTGPTTDGVATAQKCS